MRDTDAALIVSLSPDVCKSRKSAVPYPVVEFCGHDQDYTPSVRFTGQRAMVLRSRTSHVHGDEAGSGGGVVSGTCGEACEPIGHAPQVRAEGSPVIRHLDRFWMNNRNTIGEAIFVRDTQTYEAPVDDDPIPGSLRMSDAAPASLAMSAQYAQAQPAPAPGPTTTPGPKPSGQVIRPNVPQWERPPPAPTPRVGPWLRRLGKFGSVVGVVIEVMRPSPTAMPWYDELPGDAFEEALFEKARELEQQGVDTSAINDWFQNERAENARRRAQEQEEPKPVPLPQSVRVSERERYRKKCEIDTYGKMRKICGKYGMQAHHIVPDWTLRYGARADSSKRIPNLPSLNQGMSICVIGNAAMQDTEHHEAHLADGAIEALGKGSSPPGTARLIHVLDKSVKAMTAVRPDCEAQILKKTFGQFGGNDPNQLLRAVKDIGKTPLHPDTVDALESGASHPWKKGGQ